MRGDAKILFLDIENTPNLGWVWDKWQQDVIKYEREWNLLCFAWKWKGQKKVQCLALPDFISYEKDQNDDFYLTKALRELLDEADVVVAHNGKEFDVRKTNARILKHGLLPPSPYRVVDTKVIAKHVFKLNSNSLKDIAIYLDLDKKMDPGGYGLWERCMKGDPKAWAKMKKYNKQDVVVLEQVYERLLPWDAYHPNITLGSGVGLRCPGCGSFDVERRGWRTLKSWRAQRFVCKSCGKWSSGTREKLPFQCLN